jgi:hypothetical protein
MDDKEFENFKRNKDFQAILEGNETVVGNVAHKALEFYGGLDFFYKNLERFQENEKYGNPEIIHGMAPSTIRYANTAFEILTLLGYAQPKRILEIGGGYGGLCKTLSVLYPFKEYTLIDLPDVDALCTKYLAHFPELDGKINHTVSGKYDLFIADSSLAECDYKTQMEYADMAVGADYIYMVYNTLHLEDRSTWLNEILRKWVDFERRVTHPVNQDGYEQASMVVVTAKRP